MNLPELSPIPTPGELHRYLQQKFAVTADKAPDRPIVSQEKEEDSNHKDLNNGEYR